MFILLITLNIKDLFINIVFILILLIMTKKIETNILKQVFIVFVFYYVWKNY